MWIMTYNIDYEGNEIIGLAHTIEELKAYYLTDECRGVRSRFTNWETTELLPWEELKTRSGRVYHCVDGHGQNVSIDEYEVVGENPLKAKLEKLIKTAEDELETCRSTPTCLKFGTIYAKISLLKELLDELT